MVLSRSQLNDFLGRKELIEASDYVRQQLSEVAVLENRTELTKSVKNAITVIRYHLFHFAKLHQETTANDIHNEDTCILVESFVNSLEFLISLPNGVDETKVYQINEEYVCFMIESAHMVLAQRSFQDQNIETAALFSVCVCKFVERFKKLINDSASQFLTRISKKLESYGNQALTNHQLQLAKNFIMPCLLILVVTESSIKALVKSFFEWRKKQFLCTDSTSEAMLEDLELVEIPIPKKLKCDIIKLEIGLCPKQEKFNSLRSMLINKLNEQLPQGERSRDNVIIRIEKLGLEYFSQSCKKILLDECKLIIKDLKEISIGASDNFMKGITFTWMFLIRKKVNENLVITNEQGKEAMKSKDSLNTYNIDSKQPNYNMTNLISPRKDEELLEDLVDAYTCFVQAYSQIDVSILHADAYLTPKIILDYLVVVAEAFHLLCENQLQMKTLDLLIKFSDLFGIKEDKNNALADLMTNSLDAGSFSSVISEALKEILKRDQRTYSDMRLVLATAWAKYHDGLCEDAYKIATNLLEVPFLKENEKQLEMQIILSEIYLLVVNCKINHNSGNHIKEGPSVIPQNLKAPKNHQQIKDLVVEHCPFLIGETVMKMSCSANRYLASNKCSQDLSRIALAIRNNITSFNCRRLMSYMYSWAGLAAEMKLFGKLTIQIARQMTISTRVVDSNLLMAELYLLCDDHSACLLELQEVEQVLGVDICSRKKEQMKKPVKIRSKCQIQKSTMEIVLRDCNNEEIADLGSSPSLPRQLYDLPKWLLDPWDDIKNKNSVKFALFVYKFFAYHGIALEMTEDLEGSEWMIKKSQEVDAILNTKQKTIDKNSFTESEKFIVDQIFLQALITEIFGRNEKLEDAEAMLQKQSKLLSILNSAILTRNPLASKTYLKNIILVRQAQQGTLIPNIMNTPEVILKMEKLSLNPSAFKTPASKPLNGGIYEGCNSQGHIQAPARRILPAYVDIDTANPTNIITRMKTRNRKKSPSK